MSREIQLISDMTSADFRYSELGRHPKAVIAAVHEIATSGFSRAEEEPRPHTERIAERQDILLRLGKLSAPEVVKSQYYIGVEDTLTALWMTANTKGNGRQLIDPFDYEGDLARFSIGELYGPFPCAQCTKNDAWSIFVSRGDLSECPYDLKDYREAVFKFVIHAKAGRCYCDDCAPKPKQKAS